jgi:hypothetical protein
MRRKHSGIKSKEMLLETQTEAENIFEEEKRS